MAARKLVNTTMDKNLTLEPLEWRTKCFEALLNTCGELPKKLAKTYSEIRSRPLSLDEKIVQFLRNLKEDFDLNLGILTNGNNSLNKAHEGLFTWFIRASDLGARKPQLEFFIRALDSIGKTPMEVLYVTHEFKADAKGAAELGLEVLVVNPEEDVPEQVRVISKIEKIREIFEFQKPVKDLPRILLERTLPKTEGVMSYLKKIQRGQYRGLVWVVLVNPENKILLVTRKNLQKSVGVVSGGVRTKESWTEAAEREVREEVGLSVSNFTEISKVTLVLKSPGKFIEVPGRLLFSRADNSELTIDNKELISAEFHSFDKLPVLYSQNEKLLLECKEYVGGGLDE
ncbi:MAG: NUDIX domain-containing protein [Candidatus Altiarchaeota archaeon]|nr:NUDIX domain-containing protein [Candidatus Altiarchaeota archaeon]